MMERRRTLYSVILADDEPVIIEGLSRIVPWNTLGFEIKAKAYEGDELVASVKEYSPDVLITDIQMPARTGLECIEEIKHISPNTKILILSGYANFEYAKKAMGYGVEGYLLKPINRNELMEFLLRFKEELDSRERDTRLKGKALNDIIAGYLDGNSSLKRLDDIWYFFGLGSLPSEISLVLIRSNSAVEDDSLYSIIEGICEKTDAGICIKYSLSLYAIIIYSRSYLDDDAKGADDLVDDIRQNIFDSYEVLLMVIRSPCIVPDQLTHSFNELRAVIFSSVGKQDESSFEDVRNDIAKSMREGNISSIEELSVDLYTILSRLSLHDAGIESCSIVILLRHEFGSQFASEIFSPSSNYISQAWWEAMKSIDEMVYHLRSIFGVLSSKIAESLHSESVTETMVADICRYIDENYMSITRSSVAERFNMNPSYLSQSFTRFKGISFIDYVTDVRIKNAKRLLKTTNMKVQVVSEEVGYNSTQHFSKVFAKAVGCNPAEYRRREQS